MVAICETLCSTWILLAAERGFWSRPSFH